MTVDKDGWVNPHPSWHAEIQNPTVKKIMSHRSQRHTSQLWLRAGLPQQNHTKVRGPPSTSTKNRHTLPASGLAKKNRRHILAHCQSLLREGAAWVPKRPRAHRSDTAWPFWWQRDVFSLDSARARSAHLDCDASCHASSKCVHRQICASQHPAHHPLRRPNRGQHLAEPRSWLHPL